MIPVRWRAVLQCAGRGMSSRRSSESRAGWGRIVATGAAVVFLSLIPAAGMTAQSSPTVAVVDFYAPTPVPKFAGVVPERFAADDLSGMLARMGRDRFMLIPRATTEQAEADLRWHEDDVLHFARLIDLSRNLHADRLVVGWISQFVVGHEPNSDVVVHGGGGPITGFAIVLLQVFDAAQGRIVAETRAEGYGQGGLHSLVAQQTLHDALQPAIPSLISTLTSPGP
jgi:hypothetical protein